jgi:hypothetical protein
MMSSKKRRITATYKDDDAEEEEPQPEEMQKPPKKMTKNFRDGVRTYSYVKTVKSLEELDNFRFKVYQK